MSGFDEARARAADVMREPVPPSGRIFGIGLSRTGTTSLNDALEELGLTAVHYPSDERTRQEIRAFLRDRPGELRLAMLDEVQALTDLPVPIIFEALDRAYPGSRFILTVRDQASWLASCEHYWRDVLAPYVRLLAPEEADYARLLNRAVYGTEDFSAARFAAVHQHHLAHVNEYFRSRPDDCLTLDVCGGEGWERLCDFLGLPQPDAAFPHENSLPDARRFIPQIRHFQHELKKAAEWQEQTLAEAQRWHEQEKAELTEWLTGRAEQAEERAALAEESAAAAEQRAAAAEAQLEQLRSSRLGRLVARKPGVRRRSRPPK